MIIVCSPTNHSPFHNYYYTAKTIVELTESSRWLPPRHPPLITCFPTLYLDISDSFKDGSPSDSEKTVSGVRMVYSELW